MSTNVFRTRSRPTLGLLLAALALAAVPAAAQSVLAAGGLGVPLDAVDGRARALGSVGPGLFGTAVLPGDPVAAVDLSVPTLAVTLQSSWLSVDQAGRSSQSTSRIPALGAAYPVRDWGVMTLTYGAVLDQRWVLRRKRELELGAASGATSVTDELISDGGVSAVRLGFAHRVSPSLGVAGAVGSFTGSVLRRFTRSFDSLRVDVPVSNFARDGRWSYSGLLAEVGVMIDVGDMIRGVATVGWSGHLDAEPTDTIGASGRSYDLPLRLRAGMSGRLAPGLSLVVSGAYADWAATAADLTEPTFGGGGLTLGAGIEWEGATLFGRDLPLRLGWRRADLPFRSEGEDPVETSFTGGAGLVLARAGALPAAVFDLAVERGSRSGGSPAEDFWRSTLSLRVAGF